MNRWRLVRTDRWVLRSVVTAGAVILTACGGGKSAPAASATPAAKAGLRNGTAEMARTLDSITRYMYAHSSINPFLNKARAESLTVQLSSKVGFEKLNTRLDIADQWLRAGQPHIAINSLDSLVVDAGLAWETATEKEKAVFDLLALAYLRLGEQENCLRNPVANICILPLKGGAQHKKQEGARGAIERYTKLLKRFPDDPGAKWLLNLAWLQVGGYPQSVPSQYLVKQLTPIGQGNFPEYPNIAGNVGLDIYGHAGGVSIADFNGDGLLDVIASSWGLTDPMHVMIADGKGGYADRTAQAGLTGIVGGLNQIHADFDNDGDEDVIVLRGGWMREGGNYPLSLLRNKGDATFEDVTVSAGLFSIGPTNSASWADVNRDGHLDLFVGYESYKQINDGPSHFSKLFINNGDDTFTEVAAKYGIIIDDFVKGVTWGDVNNDGWPDLYLSVLYGKNRLYMNRGGTSFEEKGEAAGVQVPLAAFPTWFFDFDNDGFDDLFVPAYDVNAAMHEMVAREYLGLPLQMPSPSGPVGVEDSRLYRNRGDGTFEDVTVRAGLSRKVMFAMGSNFGDLDNDGWLDFYLGTGNPDLRSVIPNRMFHNVGGKRYEEVTLSGGFGHLQKGHAVAFADLDRDGNEDVFEVMGGAYEGDYSTSVLFHNPGWPANGWITLELQGTTANRSAFGARVAVTVRDAAGATRTIHRTVGTGGSFGAAPLQLHVGVGKATRVDSVRITWPDKARTQSLFTALQLRQTYRVVQGGQPELLSRPVVPYRTARVGPPPTMLNMPMP